MQVILREDVNHLGEVGDLVTVKAGYARNFLLPRGLAVQANDRQVRRVEHEKRIIEARVAKARRGAEDEARKLNEVVITVEKSAGENGKLFGSVTAMEIEALLRDNGFKIDRRRIQLDENIKSLGEYDLGIKLHRDVVATIKVLVVARSESE
ncbi:MAG: 50S ribosomal protein L9 [Myxococcales bacterium]|nr:50S ribosomal protein L9 [Myxococcales bacterium]|tara:strand:- start:122 stop:577 length:456 start_codon:yes stop_codon:yes gene_type:complete